MELTIEKIIKLITDKKRQEYLGRKYYYYKPERLPSTKEYNNRDNKTITKVIKNNQEVYTNWFKVLVNQKLDYSLSKPVTVNEGIQGEFNIDDIIDKTALNASIDTTGWIQLYINKQNKLDWINRYDSQIISIYDEYKKYIEKVIFFWIDEEESKEKREDEKITYVQVWDNQIVIEFAIKNEKLYGAVSKKNHYLDKLIYRDTEEEINPKGFGFVPFIPLFNNKNHESDIENLDILLDCYNEINTGFINNIREFQEMVMKLKGYGSQDLQKFIEELKKYRVVPVDENGDFDYVKVEIPVEARSVLLEIVRKNIFILGRGVDPTEDFGGSNITNVLIKSKYANLDMKCSDMEKQIRLFYKNLITVINTYYNSSLDDDIEFSRSQLFNEAELVDNCLKSMGLVSNRTILEQHPFVNNIDEELKRLEEDKQEAMDNLNQQLEQNKKVDFGDNNDNKGKQTQGNN